jgi:transposase-like protein
MKHTAKFKLQVVKFAEESNNCSASREFGINEKLVRDWRQVCRSRETMSMA